jgi:hypothetical protein
MDIHTLARLGSRARLSLLVATLLLPLAARAETERVVAVGDIHGAFDALVDILGRAGLIDERQGWIGDGARFVQTGDFTDRGSRVRDVMELLLSLEEQASTASGEVHLLLGNHEVMNLLGDDRNVLENPDIYASFTDSRSEERRQQAYERWRVWCDRRRSSLEAVAEKHAVEIDVEIGAELAGFLDQSRAEWLETHPLGLVEYREAFGPDGRYGSWLRQLPIAVTAGNSLFLHGGISPRFEKMSVQQINRIHWKRFKEYDTDRAKLVKRGLILPFFSWVETRQALELQIRVPESPSASRLARNAWDRGNELLDEIGSEDSPLWFRGYSEPPRGLGDEELGLLLDRTDKTHQVRRTIASHTPIADHEILSRLGGRLFLIDTGMLTRYYGGRASALEISPSGIKMIYAERALSVRIEIVAQPAERRPLHPVLAAWQASGSGGSPAGQATSGRVYLGADGQPLPTQDLDQLERLLSSARILSKVPISQGTSGASKLLLEMDGIRVHAIFHTVDEQRGGPKDPVVLADGQRFMYYRDSYVAHVAAYRLARLMGLENVPPTVIRRIEGTEGSVTLWIEDGTNLTSYRERDEGDPKTAYFNRQVFDMRVFDNLIDNTDRNSGNIFWTGDFDVWLIDHTRSMARSAELYRPDRLTRCSREMLERVERLDDAAVTSVLSPYLSKYEIKALLKRRDKVLATLRSNIKKMGESKVLFDYGDPLPTKIVSGTA